MIGNSEYKTFYKAKEIDRAPYLTFEFVAGSKEELKRKGLNKDPLVVREDKLPEIEFGVSKKKIKNGELVRRVITKKIKSEYRESKNKPKIRAINKEIKKVIAKGFEYKSKMFSNTSQDQIIWTNLMIQYLTGNATDQIILTKEDEEYLLLAEDIPAFYQAYSKKIVSSYEEEIKMKKELKSRD